MTLSFPAATEFLFARSAGGPHWSLGPTAALLELLGHPERHYPTIHVGGTNGKGSVCLLIAAALREAGLRVGTYTSPHLVDVRERMVVDERPIPGAAFASWTEHLRDAIVAHGASFFEATTAIALADFAARGVDVGVIEVGLGGRLDSTNVLQPVVSGVTRIDLDHTEYLGATLEAVAREKAGIAKSGVPFVIGEGTPSIASVLTEVASEAGAAVRAVSSHAVYEGALAMLGEHQRRNAAVALAILEELPDSLRPPPPAVKRGFARAKAVGRLDRRGKWIFDVAHNPGAMDAVIRTIEVEEPSRPLHALLGVLGDKPWETLVRMVARVAHRVWLVDPPSAPAARRWSASRAADVAGDLAVVEPDFDRALAEVQIGAGTILVTGSFHTVGDALARLPGFAPLG